MSATSFDQPAGEWLELVGSQVAALRYGVVQVVVHDRRVVQIERISDQEVEKAGAGAGAGTIEDLRHTGWQVAASYFLTGEENSFKAVTPKRPFSPVNGGWGAWEIAARVGELDVDNEAFPVYANPANSATKAFSWGVGLNWHLNRNVKVNVNYDQTDFQGGAATDLLRKGEKAIFTRAQISF